MSILRNKIKDRFVQVPNALVTDTRISIPARLVYVYLASKPDGWIVRNDDVKKSIGIRDNTAMAKYWKELETAGWITRKKVTSGEYAGTYDYELQEGQPIEENPNLGNSLIRENPYMGNSETINNTDCLINRDNNTPLYPPQQEEPKKEDKKQIVAELKSRINTLFHRRERTTWAVNEERRLHEISRRNDVLAECGEIEALYNSDYPYRRRAVLTFLNNWAAELDRARNSKQPQPNKYDRTTREVDYDPGF